jgi:hypothetical protein
MVISIATILLLISLIGIYSAYLYGHKVKRFRWTEYVVLLIVPVIGCLGLSYIYGIKIIYLFVLSAVIGFILEYSLGFAYHKTLNKHLWYYSRLGVGDGYTSLLTFPMWGVAGIVFWLLSQSIGI